MPLSRRDFSTLSLTALAGLALAPLPRALARRADEAPTEATFFEWKDIPGAGGGGCKIAFREGGNALLILSGKDSALVDSKNIGLGATLRREAQSFGSTLRYLINTHHHPDHVGGNPAFYKHCPLVAHKNARPRIEKQVESHLGRVPHILKAIREGEKPASQRVIDEVKAFEESIAGITPAHFGPTNTIEHDKGMFKVGELTVDLYHYGPGHTDNDLIIHLPALNLIHMGDLLFHKLHPFIDRPGGANTTGWQKSLREATKLCDEKTIVIPGHGDLTDVAGIQGQIEYFDKVRDIVSHAKNVDGMTREEVVKLETGAFEGFGHMALWPRVLGAVYDEVALNK